MPTPAQLTLDPWAGLSHKDTVAKPSSAPGVAPTWVGTSHLRRLTAYLVLWAYLKNSVRFFLRTDPTDPDRYVNHREYGDPALLTQTIRAAVIGDEPRALVDGADEDVPREPRRGDIEVDPDLEDGELEAALTAALAEAVQEWDEDRTRIEAAMARQEWLDEWWDDELAAQKVIESESNTVGLGDGVYELVNSTDKKRPRLRIHDPGFYFPVHDDDAQADDYPNRVHLAWEWEDDDGKRFVRRITYDRLRGEAWTPSYADESTEWRVYKTDATWQIQDLHQSTKFGVDNFDMGKARFAVNEDGEEIHLLDLQIDFIPVVHVPNTPAIIELWGESSLTRVAQILDDLMANDTDTAVAAALVAAPPIAISGSASGGAGAKIETYGPGTVFRTGDGKMDVLDTSHSLDALLAMQDKLLERLSVNRQVPQSILGRVDLSGQLAGITLLLSFGPFRQYVSDLRLVRKAKYGLLLKFVQRMAISGGWLDEAIPLDANLAFGPFLPTDTTAIKDLVVALVNTKLMSRATGMRAMQEAGVDIDSIEDELDAVRKLDFEGAGALADAVADDQAARVYLGIPDLGGAEDATGGGSERPAPVDESTPPGETAPPTNVPPVPLP